MKNLCYIFIFLVVTAFSGMAQDVAICGWDGSGSSSSGDEFSFVLLRDFAAGEIIYFTEDEYSTATGNFNTGEGHIAYTVPAGGLLENEVVGITETSNGVFGVLCGAGGTAVDVGGFSWSLVTDGLGGCTDEIYAYSASNPSAPWSSVTEVHSFIWASNVVIPAGQNPSTDWPNAIVIAFNIGGPWGVNADFKNAERINTTLANFQNGTNWLQPQNNVNLSCTNFTTQMIALPVELIHFDAHKNADNVMLKWSTASEINNEYFQIEHSTDGKNFENIEQINGVGNSTNTNHYDFTHKNPVSGINYYRLKQVDYDGNFEYSNIVPLEFRKEAAEILAYPNPFTESMTLKIPSLEGKSSDNECTIEVFDIYNRLVQSNTFSNNNEPIQLNLAKHSPGIYSVCIHLGQGEITTLRVVKE